MTPKFYIVKFCDDPPKNIQKSSSSYPKKYYFFWKPPKIMKFKILNQKNDPSLRMYENIMSTPPGIPDPPPSRPSLKILADVQMYFATIQDCLIRIDKKTVYNLCTPYQLFAPWEIFHAFCHLPIIFKIQFLKNYFGIPFMYLTDWIQIRPDKIVGPDLGPVSLRRLARLYFNGLYWLPKFYMWACI